MHYGCECLRARLHVVVIVWRPWLAMQPQTCFFGVIELDRLE
jgi:hypothetical protein